MKSHKFTVKDMKDMLFEMTIILVVLDTMVKEQNSKTRYFL